MYFLLDRVVKRWYNDTVTLSDTLRCFQKDLKILKRSTEVITLSDTPPLKYKSFISL